jgi:hypothetical protein
MAVCIIEQFEPVMGPSALGAHACTVHDFVWRLPLSRHTTYRNRIKPMSLTAQMSCPAQLPVINLTCDWKEDS